MELIGEYVTAQRLLNGDLTITFAINDDMKAIDKLESLKGTELVIDFDKYFKKRSLNANRYLWKLCDAIARVLGSDKDTVYLLQLRKYGVWTDIEIVREAVPVLRDKNIFRYIEELEEDGEMLVARCYYGSSHYDTQEMSHLLTGTVNDAHDLGISTWTQEEIDRLISEWKGEK